MIYTLSPMFAKRIMLGACTRRDTITVLVIQYYAQPGTCYLLFSFCNLETSYLYPLRFLYDSSSRSSETATHVYSIINQQFY